VSDQADLKDSIKERYGARGEALASAPTSSCCESDSSCCGEKVTGVNAFSEALYLLDELEDVPLRAALARLGCGNPTALVDLRAGETVLDLGSGGGIDVLLSAKRVGPRGHVYGVDMTDEMLALAWKNALEAGVTNVTFLKGDIEDLPLPDDSVDTIISNCVVNLAADKDRVVAEMYRVVRPGGRIAVSDVVIDGGIPEGDQFYDELRADLEAWGSCIGGAMSDAEYRVRLERAGFGDVEIRVTRHHTTDELFPSGLPEWANAYPRNVVDDVMGRFTSAFVSATRPAV
jgi:ubiquinone/menaquinone biosynthesis C-methylase UbiE